MPPRDDDGDYEVGYGKPPVQHRFKKGQSGNPRGRPPGAKGFAASVRRELESRITIREGGRDLTISKREAAGKVLMNKALGGDLKALAMLQAIDADEVQAVAAEIAQDYDIPLEAHEIAMLEEVFAKRRAQENVAAGSGATADDEEQADE
ncbi:DUF5681 domain-containing protein [Wenxinia marina]|uniref:DUF5681 domain-containing protein n=1 Tax=Wenxinia marina DSM 24838 TaxID=1123501 RepID=A0A0D0QGU3_9RHOB|nr:DUF5681 domain-containing protein [Wenxinia marina]KIQ70193.1 hypothetical protein Wenmar_01152 [Wenxinia marina DSM 24838]GGL50717.1 hypothetical protein GCM10011392_01050 [Wenxinia marina]